MESKQKYARRIRAPRVPRYKARGGAWRPCLILGATHERYREQLIKRTLQRFPASSTGQFCFEQVRKRCPKTKFVWHGVNVCMRRSLVCAEALWREDKLRLSKSDVAWVPVGASSLARRAKCDPGFQARTAARQARSLRCKRYKVERPLPLAWLGNSKVAPRTAGSAFQRSYCDAFPIFYRNEWCGVGVKGCSMRLHRCQNRGRPTRQQGGQHRAGKPRLRQE